MDHLSYHRDILERAISGRLPSQINRDSDVSVEIFHELFKEGLVTGIDASSMNKGLGYLNPAITLKGREYLDNLIQRSEEKSLRGRAKKFGLVALGWLAGVGSVVLAEWLGKLL